MRHAPRKKPEFNVWREEPYTAIRISWKITFFWETAFDWILKNIQRYSPATAAMLPPRQISIFNFVCLF